LIIRQAGTNFARVMALFLGPAFTTNNYFRPGG
jgi:hypothetical protein